MDYSFLNCASKGEIIIMAGAGVSAGNPSALPGWNAINAAIVKVLCQRLESATRRPGWVSQLIPVIETERGEGRFPPDYQAQVIEEMCGERYFKALQALDVDVINAGHDGIAALAASGAVKAVVTTNFDRLIEQALDKRGVNYVVACDDEGYMTMLQQLIDQKSDSLPILKIHGCVSDHISMIDTLKQRKLGRSRHLQECLNMLNSGYWLYLGFSAADIETDTGYLGLVTGASKSAGATYVAYPGNTSLGKGAKKLMNAYGDYGEVLVTHVAEYLNEICHLLGVPGPDSIPDDTALGTSEFQESIEAWASGLSAAAAGLSLAAILEAIGQAESSVRILDRLVRKELRDERSTADFRALQLHYGRLGSAWGRFVAVPDMNGFQCNACVETMQSLMRLTSSEQGFAAASWLMCLMLWLNNGKQATATAIGVFNGFIDGEWEGISPKTHEEALDAWLSATQVCILNSHSDTIRLVMETAGSALEQAKESGDVVRRARVIALKCLALAETRENVPELLSQYEEVFCEAERAGDGFALGMKALSLGRWYLGVGGLTVTNDRAPLAPEALALLREAAGYFQNQCMDPWELFSLMQQAKAFGDLGQNVDAQNCINTCAKGVERFPILASHFHEMVGQLRHFLGDSNAKKSFQAAVETAGLSGLFFRREVLMKYLDMVE